MKYDYLIVGAGFFGATFAEQAMKKNKRCVVIDRRTHIAGNSYTENINGIQVHKYGAHIFHTRDAAVWEYVNRFATFNHFRNSPVAKRGAKMYSLPFNMNTFYQLWGVTTPIEAQNVINTQCLDLMGNEPKNLAEQALSLVGRDIYEILIKEYTQKQWGRKCEELPMSIIKRIPLRFTFDNNYFDDPYQGIPVGGYTQMVEKMLSGCEVILDTDYVSFITQNKGIAKTVIYTGAIDEFFDYQLGTLEYRSLRFEEELLDIDNYQGNAVVNYVSADKPLTRIIEHKHFDFGLQKQTIITREYPATWSPGNERYYPIKDVKNNELFRKYMSFASAHKDIYFGGRLGMYEYYDMDKAIHAALSLAKKLL